MLINGEACRAGNGATFERRNPLDGGVATQAPAATVADATAAVEAAATAFKTRSQTGPGERRAFLSKAADALEAQGEAFAQAMAAETGSSALWAGFNVHLAADMLREAAAITTQISGEVIPSNVPGSVSMAVRQPAGVVLAIAPRRQGGHRRVHRICAGSRCRGGRGSTRSEGDIHEQIPARARAGCRMHFHRRRCLGPSPALAGEAREAHRQFPARRRCGPDRPRRR